MSYFFIIIPFVALFFTQIVKIILDSAKGKFSWKNLDSYGGMPSSHAAFLAAAITVSCQQLGPDNPITAVLTFITFIVLRDAVGLRRYVGKQAEVINSLIKDLPDNLEDKYPYLETRVGHTYPQILVGAAIGIILALIL